MSDQYIGGVRVTETGEQYVVASPNPNPTSLSPKVPAAAVVGTSNNQILPANISRRGLVLTNLSANTVSLGLGTTAVINTGITLTQSGTWVMDQNTFTTAAINAVASAAGSNIAMQEFN